MATVTLEVPASMRAALIALAAVGILSALPAGAADPPARLEARGHDSRIDLRWEPAAGPDIAGWNVYRAETPAGPWQKLNADPLQPPLTSDFLGANGLSRCYRVTTVGRDGGESAPSPAAQARTRAMSDEELLTSVQWAAFRYFWDWGHPASGLAREADTSGDTCTTGGTGFGLMAILVGAERGFVSRPAAAARTLKILTFLQEKAERYHGAWSHWLNGATGKTIPFSEFDDGGDLVETSFLVQGILAARQYFDQPDPTETDIRRRATQLWREVEWSWYLGGPAASADAASADRKQLFWHWSPRYGWKMNHRIGGHFNECLITYVLAMASPTHPIPPECYEAGWVGDAKAYANGRSYYGIRQPVGWPMGGPLFFTHYSFLGLDPRGRRDRFCDYFENNRAITRIHIAYCAANPRKHQGYGPLWGITASDDPDGYAAHAPGDADNGTIAPTAALSAMPYAPAESLAALKRLYHTYGDRLWGPFGFRDAMNLDRNWFARRTLAIDQGPIICMIENARTGLLWRVFMQNREIDPALKRAGWTVPPAAGQR